MDPRMFDAPTTNRVKVLCSGKTSLFEHHLLLSARQPPALFCLAILVPKIKRAS